MASRAAILDLDHVQVAVPPGAEEACRAFYVTLLGMPEIAKPQALVARGGVWVQVGKRQLHLGVEKEFQPARKAHPAFAVSDIDDLAERVAHEGRDVVWDNETIPGLRRFHTHDPFGNRLEFVESQDVSNR
jgi:catechol 2,3-dioxygenase-like lactoylglutathione lyase family enzyme